MKSAVFAVVVAVGLLILGLQCDPGTLWGPVCFLLAGAAFTVVAAASDANMPVYSDQNVDVYLRGDAPRCVLCIEESRATGVTVITIGPPGKQQLTSQPPS